MRRHAKAIVAAWAMLLILALAPQAALADTAPTPSIDPPTNVTFNSADLSGTVNPNGGPSTAFWYFQYRLKDEEGENWQYANFEAFSEEDSAKSEALPVTGFINWLEPGKQYLIRLGASNDGGEQFSSEEEIETEAVEPPEASNLSVSDVTDSGARFSGTVNSKGTGEGEATSYRFECSPQCPGLPGDEPIVSDGTDQAVEAEAKDLEPNTEYTVWLIATNAAFQQDIEEAKFTTGALAPLAVTAYAAPRTTTTARLNGWVTPRNSPTTYYFEYGPEDCSSNPCTAVPASEDADAGSDNTHHLVSQEISGLSEATTYHYRLIAENASGTTEGEDLTFKTRTAAEMTLPVRGYELVNTPDKGNQHVFMFPYLKNDLDSSGSHAFWAVQAGAPGTNVGANAAMLATRTENGWVSRSLIPPAKEQIGNGSLQFSSLEMAPDGSSSLFLAHRGFFAGAGVSVVRTYGAGPQEELGFFPNTAAGSLLSIDATPDLKHVVFYTDATGEERQVVDYGVSPPELISVLPEGTPDDCGATGFYNRIGAPGYHWMSMEDASLVYFQASDCSKEALYIRDRDAKVTEKIADNAELIRASWDGTDALFTAEGSLTPDDQNATPDIYRYEDGELTSCVTCIVKEAAVPMLDQVVNTSIVASSDLSRVYFESDRSLVKGMGKGAGRKRYVISGGRIRYVSSRAPIDPWKSKEMLTTPDARVLYFVSEGDPTGDGTEGTFQLYRYDDGDGSLECVSCSHGLAADLGLRVKALGEANFRISADGGTVAFSTRTKLLPGDVNGTADVYQWRNGRRSLITDGVTEFPGFHGEPLVRGVDADGDNILFSVAAPLTGFEQDTVANLYVARVGGGFEPPPPPVHCSEESCQGPLAPAPATQAPGSATSSGPGNQASKPQRKAKRKQRKRRTRKRAGKRGKGKAAKRAKAKQNGKRG